MMILRWDGRNENLKGERNQQVLVVFCVWCMRTSSCIVKNESTLAPNQTGGRRSAWSSQLVLEATWKTSHEQHYSPLLLNLLLQLMDDEWVKFADLWWALKNFHNVLIVSFVSVCHQLLMWASTEKQKKHKKKKKKLRRATILIYEFLEFIFFLV